MRLATGLLLSLAALSLVADRSSAADKDCGPNCLAATLSAFEIEYDHPDLLSRFGKPKRSGYSLAKIADVASEYGLEHRLVKTNLENLLLRGNKERFTCICWLQEQHFVICNDFSDGDVQVVDPPKFTRQSAAAFSTLWTGEALLLSDQPLQPESELAGSARWWIGALCIGCVLMAGSLVRKKWMAAAACILLCSYTNTCAAQTQSQPDTKTARAALNTDQPKSNSPRPPVIRLSERYPKPIHLGNAKTGKKHAFSLELHNDLLDDVDLASIRMSCSCLKCTVEKGPLARGKHRKLTIEVETTTGGDRKANFTLYTKDGSRIIAIPVEWTVVHQLSWKPAAISFGEVEGHGEYELEFAVTRHNEQGKAIKPRDLGASATPDDVLETTVEGDTVHLRLRDCAKAYLNNGYVYLTDADMPGGSTVAVPVSWRRRAPAISTNPKVLRTTADAKRQLKFFLSAREGDLGDVTKIDCEYPIEQWKFQRATKRSGKVTLTIDTSSDKKLHSARSIRLTIAGESGPVRIPIYILQAGGANARK